MIIVNTIFHIIYQFTLSCSTFNPQAGISGIFRRVNTYWVLCPRGIVTVSFASSRLTICTSYCLIIIISYLNKNALSQSLFVWRFGGWQTFILLLMPIGLEQTFLRPHWILSQLTSKPLEDSAPGLLHWEEKSSILTHGCYIPVAVPRESFQLVVWPSVALSIQSIGSECAHHGEGGEYVYIYVCVCVCVCVYDRSISS